MHRLMGARRIKWGHNPFFRRFVPENGPLTYKLLQTPLRFNKYVRPRNTRTEMYAGRVVCCLVEYYTIRYDILAYTCAQKPTKWPA